MEYKRRYSEKKQERKFTLSVSGNRIKAYPSAFEIQALGYWQTDTIRGLNNQTVNYFVMNRVLWKNMQELADDGKITIDPKLKDAVSEAFREAEKLVCPLYPTKPQQRLGFLAEADTVECIKDDDERGFVAGEKYSVYAKSQVLSAEYVEKKETEDGDIQERQKRKEWKVLNLTIGSETFSEVKADIEYIIEHFHIPDPGDLASNHPAETAEMIDLLESLEVQGVEGREDWRFKGFQKADIARLLMKRGGLLAWEMGLGKTLGGLAFAEAAIKLGAEDKVLFIVPQDL